MNPRIFDLSRGRQFVAGLFWQPLPGLLRERKKETERLAKELNFDLAVWRTSGALQVGFCSSSKEIRPGALSAAAVVSKTLEVDLEARNFLCATEVPDGSWLYVAQRDGIILPDGDFIGSEDEVRSRILNDLSLDEWTHVIAPDHWGIANAVERSFLQFLPQKGGKNDFKRWWGLQPVKKNIFRTLLPITALAVVVIGGTYGYSTWKEKKLAAEMAQIAADQASIANQPVKLEHPWKKQPRAGAVMSECMKSLASVKTLWPGNWEPRTVSCSTSAMTIGWGRGETGWIEHLRAVEPKAMISLDGSVASLTVPIKLPEGEDEALPVENDRVLMLHSTGQRYGFKVSITTPPAPPTLPGDQQAAQKAVKDWRELSWKVDGVTLPPSVVLETMDGAGFRVTSIQANIKGGLMAWNMEGTQYVQP